MSQEIGGIRLEWEVNTINGEGQYIYRSTTPMDIEDMPVPIANISPEVNYYNDDTVINNILYYYRVGSYSGTEVAISDEFPIFSAPRGPSFITGTDFSSDSNYIVQNSVVRTSDAWLLANDGGAIYASGNGLSWATITSPIALVRKLAVIGSTVVVAGYDRYGYKLSRSVNNGVSWTNTQDPFTGYINALGSFSHSGTFYLYASITNDLFISTNDGVSWVRVEIPDKDSSLSVTAESVLNDTPICFLFGSEGLFYYSYDGEVWDIGSGMAVFDQIIGSANITVDEINRIYVADAAGSVAYSTDGLSYTQVTSISGSPTTLASDNKYTLIATLDTGDISISTNYGVTWNNVPTHSPWDNVISHGVFYDENFGWLHVSYGNSGDGDLMRPAVSAIKYFS
jgi:hypothetical protein